MNLITQEGSKMEHRTSLSVRWAAAHDDLHARRASHESGRTLVPGLASYATLAEQHELNAILQRSDPDTAAQIRSISLQSRIILRSRVA